MSTSKAIDKICAFAIVLALLLTMLFMNGQVLGVQAVSRVMGYEAKLFDTDTVHTIEIVMDDWESFIETCENEEYAACSVVIDGEAYKNIGIRAKGNTSLSNVSSMNSDRYSFKLEFDQYENGKSYYGLDKLSLNNIIQDTTYMKDYLTYRLMGEMGVAAPLCSYVYITVNGEDWGLYLAVEGVEDAFLQRNYGTDHGELYKPDSMNFGGGRGNGKDFNMQDFEAEREKWETENAGEAAESAEDTEAFSVPEIPAMPGGFDPSQMESFDFSQMLPEGAELPENFDTSSFEEVREQFGKGGFGGDFGMGSSDAKLQYIDDDPDSYSTIFDSAKTEITEADMERLIASLKALSEGNARDAVAIDEVIRYFVVHNFVCNGDSYTGSMIHNYYLYEEDGLLQMIPWDYNLAFGTFQGGSNATSTINDPIDTPVSGGTGEDRPMIGFIFENEEYTEQYHQIFAQFLEQTDFAALIDETAALIAPYVEKDPSKFYSFEEFEKGIATLREFCLLREESILGQLDGTIPSTTEGQRADDSALIDASHITISDMGSMNMGGGFGGRGDRENRRDQLSGNASGQSESITPEQPSQEIPEGFDPAQAAGGQMPDGFAPNSMGSGQMPENFNPTQMNGEMQMPNGFGGMNGDMQQRPGNAVQQPDTAVTETDTDLTVPAAKEETSSSGRENRSQMPDMMQFPDNAGTSGQTASDTVPQLVISIVILTAGMVFAVLFKKHR